MNDMITGLAYLLLIFLIMGGIGFICWLTGKMLEEIENIQNKDHEHRKSNEADRQI